MTTEFGKRNQLEDGELRVYPVCWYWPESRTPYGISVWGGVLVVVGGIWLLSTLELLPRLVQDSLGPIVVILIGIAYLINTVLHRE